MSGRGSAAKAATPSYAVFRVKSLAAATQTSAGQVTIEYRVQTAAGQPLSAVKTAVLNATTGRAYFDFDGGASSATNWDISLENYAIRVNGGVSGTAGVAVVVWSSGGDAATASAVTARCLSSGLSPSVLEFHQLSRSTARDDAGSRVADSHRRWGIAPRPDDVTWARGTRRAAF